MNSDIAFAGDLSFRVLKKPQSAPALWTFRNRTRKAYIFGFLSVELAKAFSKMTGIPTLTSRLSIRYISKDGDVIDYGIVGYRVVTTAGVNWLVDAWQGTYEPETMKYHACGTGTGGEVVGDTSLGTECTTTLNPDSTRATGSLTEGSSANIFKSVGTLTFDGSAAVTEHGLVNAASGAHTLWDRTVYTAVNVVSGDSIEFTYELTVNSGG